MGMTSVDLGLRVIPNKNLPDTWDYQQSVNKVKSLILSFKNVTNEMLHELWVARWNLSDRGSRPNRDDSQNWTGYLSEIGLPSTTAHRWLTQYVPEEKRKKTPEEIADHRRRIEEANEAIKKAQSTQGNTEVRQRLHEAAKAKGESIDIDETFSKLDGIIGDLADREAEKTRFREKIKMTGDNQKDPFFDVLAEYLSSLSDNQTMEACHNIIKYCKRVVNNLHVMGANGESE